VYDSSILECKRPASVSIAPAIQSVLPCSCSLLPLLLASFPHGCQRARRRLAGDESESEDEKLEFAGKKLQLTDYVIPEKKKFRDPSMYASAGFSDVYLSAGDTESYHQKNLVSVVICTTRWTWRSTEEQPGISKTMITKIERWNNYLLSVSTRAPSS